jgi:DNA repair protein RadA/Sms
MGESDAYVNLAGGMRIAEPSLDLGICLALISSFRNKPISGDVIAFGAVGLSGEVRSVNMGEARVAEARKLGFHTCIVPKALESKLRTTFKDVEIIGVSSISDAMKLI